MGKRLWGPLTAEEVKAVRVSDATGLVTGNPVTDPEAIRRLVEAMRQDAEAFDPTTLRDSSACGWGRGSGGRCPPSRPHG